MLPPTRCIAVQLYDLYAREYVGPPVDVWALGVLLYLLAFGRLPFEGEAKLQVGPRVSQLLWPCCYVRPWRVMCFVWSAQLCGIRRLQAQAAGEPCHAARRC